MLMKPQHDDTKHRHCTVIARCISSTASVCFKQVRWANDVQLERLISFELYQHREQLRCDCMHYARLTAKLQVQRTAFWLQTVIANLKQDMKAGPFLIPNA